MKNLPPEDYDYYAPLREPFPRLAAIAILATIAATIFLCLF